MNKNETQYKLSLSLDELALLDYALTALKSLDEKAGGYDGMDEDHDQFDNICQRMRELLA